MCTTYCVSRDDSAIAKRVLIPSEKREAHQKRSSRLHHDGRPSLVLFTAWRNITCCRAFRNAIVRIVFGPSCQPSICRGALQPLVEMTVSGAPPQSEFASSILANCAENPCCRSIMFEGQVQRVVSRGALAAEGFLKIQQKMQQDSSALSVVKSPIRPHTREVEVEGGQACAFPVACWHG